MHAHGEYLELKLETKGDRIVGMVLRFVFQDFAEKES